MIRYFILSALLLWGIAGFSQLSLDRQVIGTTGGYGQVGTLSLSYTMGEMSTKTAITTNGMLILTQGFQQPDTGFFVGIEKPIAFPVEYTIYPNPTSGVLRVDLTTDRIATVIMDVHDMRGRKTSVPLQNIRFEGTRTTIFNLEALADGFYLFNFRNEKGELIKTEKVQKVH